jgi:hypothetical protein
MAGKPQWKRLLARAKHKVKKKLSLLTGLGGL